MAALLKKLCCEEIGYGSTTTWALELRLSPNLSVGGEVEDDASREIPTGWQLAYLTMSTLQAGVIGCGSTPCDRLAGWGQRYIHIGSIWLARI